MKLKSVRSGGTGSSISVERPPAAAFNGGIQGRAVVPRVVFTPNLARHLPVPERTVPGGTVREVLDAVFADDDRLRGYVLDDQRRVRQHVVVFVDGRPIRDRLDLSDSVGESSEIYVMQALSGG
jgi:sulfur-carrier protein